jgi:hypothetical protein
MLARNCLPGTPTYISANSFMNALKWLNEPTKMQHQFDYPDRFSDDMVHLTSLHRVTYTLTSLKMNLY